MGESGGVAAIQLECGDTFLHTTLHSTDMQQWIAVLLRLWSNREPLTRCNPAANQACAGCLRPNTKVQVLKQPVSPTIDLFSKTRQVETYGITRTLYVLAAGVPATSAQTFTVTTPAAET